MIAGNRPLISIGITVFNGENYLVEAIESILAQTISDFELIICDNASTDATEDICRRYVESDPRVRYYKKPKKSGSESQSESLLPALHGSLFQMVVPRRYDRLGLY